MRGSVTVLSVLLAISAPMLLVAGGAQEADVETLYAVGMYSEDEVEGIFQRFEEEYGVAVDYTHAPSERYPEIFTAMAQAGDPIDLKLLNGQDLRRYAVGGQLMDLTDHVDYTDEFVEAGIDTYTIGDRLWGVPWRGVSGFAILYNTEVLEEHNLDLPDTYDELLQISEVLRENGVAPYVHGGSNLYLWPVWFFKTYAQTTGGNEHEETFETLRGNQDWTEPAVVEALDAIFRYAEDGLFMEGTLGMDEDAALASLATGDAAFMLHHTNNLMDGGDHLGVALPPAMEEGMPRHFPGNPGGDPISIYSGSENQELALEFARFATTDENMKLLAEEQNFMTTVKPHLDPVDLHPAADEWLSIYEKVQTYLDWYWPPEITRAFQEGIQAGVGGRKTAEEVAQDIQNVFDQIVADGYEFQD